MILAPTDTNKTAVYLVMVPVAGSALKLGQAGTDDALAGGARHHVRHVQQLRGQDPLVHLELAPEPTERNRFSVINGN